MRESTAAFASTATWLMAIAAVAAFAPQAARADEITPPRAPDDIVVPDGNKPFLVGHALGTQNYICLPSGTGFSWTLFTPEATLLADDDGQIITHFFSPNPLDGAIQPSWLHSRDSSAVWAKLFHAPSTDPLFVAKDAIPWLLLQKSGDQFGPTGGDVLTATTFVQRVNTSGGVAPPTGCLASGDIGKKAFVPYTADYFFYKATGPNGG